MNVAMCCQHDLVYKTALDQYNLFDNHLNPMWCCMACHHCQLRKVSAAAGHQ